MNDYEPVAVMIDELMLFIFICVIGVVFYKLFV